MKKNIFLGVDDNGECCVLSSLASFDELCANSSNIEKNDFIHYSTNWSGYDDIQRTLELKNLELTKRIMKLSQPLTFTGKDYDWGHVTDWSFTINYIYETREK